MTKDGVLVITPHTDGEAYALSKWLEDNKQLAETDLKLRVDLTSEEERWGKGLGGQNQAIGAGLVRR